MELRITAFGQTWVDSDHPLWLILSVAAAFIFANLALCRVWGKYHPEKSD